MKTKIKFALALLAIALVFGTSTCVDQEALPLGKDAALGSLRCEDVFTKETVRVSDIQPSAISSAQYDSETFEMVGALFGRASFNRADPETGSIYVRLRPSVSRDATVQWGIGTRSNRPDYYYDTRVPARFESDEYLYLKITSGDKATVNYYRFYTRLYSWVTDLASISIDSREGLPGLPGTAYDEAEESSISITTGEGNAAVVEAVTFDPNATYRVAVVKRNNESAAPQFRAPGSSVRIEDQDLLYVEVIAENEIDKAIYKFRANVGRMATIKQIIFNDGSSNIEIFGKGLPDANWADVGPGDYSTADQPISGFGINLIPDDPEAEVQWAFITAAGAAIPSVFNNPAKIVFTDKQAIGIKVTSRNAGNNGIKFVMYYKVRVNILAANISKHPKSAWYYYNDPAAPLTVELDRQPSGGLPYEYQWYESDSWYGIYGRHGADLDEKNNVSGVNGGPGQYFYLVEPDEISWSGAPLAWSIPGANAASYTPPTNWINVPVQVEPGTKQPIPPTPPEVNFLEGSTSECRYYWVKVTDPNSGLSVVSDRALILTEHNQKVKHFIFDLTALPIKKNIEPFKVIREMFKIDLAPMWDAMPKTGNNGVTAFSNEIYKYVNGVAHAQYFLLDGRPWTQNWTHGDLHFGMNDGSLTWWQNNMGSNSGAFPAQSPHSSQGGLNELPDWIGFAPSGDIAKGIPRPDPKTGELPKGIYSMNASDPYPAGVAQGYFAGFIELLEIRFSYTQP